MPEFQCKYTPAPQPTDAQRKGENREDFMKRWFAIALSVGFATALSRMPWLADGLIFKPDLNVDPTQINQGFRLFAAGTATLLSWEGYLSSIRSKPLTDNIRFYVDVILVTLYLILLLTSSSPFFWIWIHCIAFLIYMYWDYLSIGVFPQSYNDGKSEEYPDRTSIYRALLTGKKDIYHGPLVTIVWSIYIITVAITYEVNFNFEEKSSPVVTFAYFVFIFFGLLRYREDKGNKDRSPLWRLVNVVLASTAVIVISNLLGEIDNPVRSMIGF